MAVTDRAHAADLDRGDPLGPFRSRFVDAEPGLVYLDGNSLGMLPRATAARLHWVVEEEWGRGLIRSWDAWVDLPQRVGDRLGTTLLGARPGETVVADSTTVNLYKALTAAVAARPGRSTIVVDGHEFPTDRYVAAAVADAHHLQVRGLGADDVAGPTPADVERAVADGDVAAVVVSLVSFRSGAWADLAGITATARAAGAIVVWDLSHAVGSVPVDLPGAGADIAVGCTYKYLCGGPGAPAFIWVDRDRQAEMRQPVWGWFAQRDQFAMGPAFDPLGGAAGWLSGSPPVLGLAAVDEGVGLVGEAGMGAIRAKSEALTALAVELVDAWLGPLGGELATPRMPGRRGAHVSVRHHRADALVAALGREKVVADFRPPDLVRLGLSPLTTRFTDVWDGLDRFRRLLASQT
jgi:kynureninase